MQLPTYITGFTENGVTLREMNGQQFKQVVYNAARITRARALHVEQPRYPLHYFRIDVLLHGERVSVLLHRYFPYVALAHYTSSVQIQFIDDDTLMRELQPYYTVLSAAFLDEPFQPQAHRLAEIERRHEKHWRPNTNGDVIFNCWD